MEDSFEQRQRLEKARKRVKSIKGFYKHLIIYLLVNGFILIMRAIKLDPGEEFWTWSTFSVVGWWGFGLIVHGISVFGRNAFLNRDWEERKIKELMDKEKNKANRWE